EEFVQFPGLLLWRRNDPCLCVLPLLVQPVHFFLPVEIEPNQHGAGITVVLSEEGIGQKDSAMPFRDSRNPAIFAAPVHFEAEVFFIVLSSLVDITYRYFGDSSGKIRVHLGSLVRSS